MKIIVCVKQVPDTSGKVAVNPDGTLNRASMATITNPDDLNAVEAALVLKEQTGGCHQQARSGRGRRGVLRPSGYRRRHRSGRSPDR